jgi:HEPN domain-containing protein
LEIGIEAMLDVEKQVSYWRDGAIEDWEVAQTLTKAGRIRHGLFFAHLCLEKLLKAHSCRHTQTLAPRIHNLVRLAHLTDLQFTTEQINVLAEMNAFNLEGRYPDSLTIPPTQSEAMAYLHQTEEVYLWLLNQL